MNRITKLCMPISIWIMACCTSAPKNPAQRNITIKDVEIIPLGQTMDDLHLSFGSPTKLLNSEGETTWTYYSPPDGYQRTAFIFDPQSSKLISKTVLLFESDRESDLEYLIKNKFVGHNFKSVSFPQCGWDFIPGEALYIEVKTGLSILYRKNMNEAESIGWTTPTRAEQAIKEIESCKGRSRQPRN